jgi:hypothetical protein
MKRLLAIAAILAAASFTLPDNLSPHAFASGATGGTHVGPARLASIVSIAPRTAAPAECAGRRSLDPTSQFTISDFWICVSGPRLKTLLTVFFSPVLRFFFPAPRFRARLSRCGL